MRTTLYHIVHETKKVKNTTAFPGKERTETKWFIINRAGYKVIERDTLEQILEQLPKYHKNYGTHL